MSAKGRPWNAGNVRMDSDEQIAACLNCHFEECINCHGYNPRKNGKRNELKKPIDQFDLNGTFLHRWPSTVDAAAATGIWPQTISNCLRGRSRRCGKYIWRYAEQC